MEVVVHNPKVKRKQNKKRKRKSGFHIIALAVFVVFLVMAFNTVSLQKDKKALENQYWELEEKLQDEQERSKFLKDRAAYMQTTRYIEEIARERLGLVYKEEIIFRPETEE